MKSINLLRFIFAVSPVLLSVPSMAYQDMNTAVVRILNKAAGKVQTINMPVNQKIAFEKLNIVIHSCKQTDPFQAENFFMFAEVYESDTKIFSGWMSRNEPGNNPLQNPDYDLWLVRCE